MIVSSSITQKLYYTAGYRSVALWIAGNGVSEYTVTSAKLTQGSVTVNVTSCGKTSFKIPKLGRYTDSASLLGFVLPGEVSFTVTVENEMSIVMQTPSSTDSQDSSGVTIITEPGLVTKVTGTKSVMSGSILFDLEFEGTFVDSVNGLTPTQQQYVELETSTRLFGDGCLKVGGSSEYSILQYTASSAMISAMKENGWTMSGFGEILGERQHSAQVYKKTSGGYDCYIFANGVLSYYSFISDAVIDDYIVLSLTLFNIVMGEGNYLYVDGIQIISGALWTSSFTPPANPFISLSGGYITGYSTSGEQLSVSSACDLTFSDQPEVDDTVTITVGGQTEVFTFVSYYTGNENEIVIGANLEATVASATSVINGSFGALLGATSSGYVVTVTAYTDETLVISTTSSSISVGTVSYSVEGSGYAELPAFACSGVAKDHGVFGNIYGLANIPALTCTGTATRSGNIADMLIPAFSVSSQSLNFLPTANSSSTDAEKLILLDTNDDYIKALIEYMFAYDTFDELVLQAVKWVSMFIAYQTEETDAWKSAKETLYNGYGDCEDGAILLFSLLINAGIPASRLRIYFGEYSGIGHAWLAYLSNDGYWITIDWTQGAYYWTAITTLDEVPLAYYEDYYLYDAQGYSYMTSASVVPLTTTNAYADSIVGRRIVITYPDYTISGSIGGNANGVIDYPDYTVSGSMGSVIDLNYPSYNITGSILSGTVNSISITYPIFTVEGNCLCGDIISCDIDYPSYTIEASGYENENLNVALIYPKYSVEGSISSVYTGEAIRMNTLNFAVSMYGNFKFNSMCYFNGKIIGASDDYGILEHSGDTDDGDNIEAYFTLPSVDYQTHKQKSFRKIYLEGLTEGNIEVCPIVDGIAGIVSNVYSIGSISDVQYIFPMSHSDKGTNLGLKIANINGSKFSVDSIYATLIVSSTLPSGYTEIGRSKFTYPEYEVSASAS